MDSLYASCTDFDWSWLRVTVGIDACGLERKVGKIVTESLAAMDTMATWLMERERERERTLQMQLRRLNYVSCGQTA